MNNENQIRQIMNDCSRMRISADKAVLKISQLMNEPCADCGNQFCICTKLLIIDYGDDEE
jgi:hypothetical protein